MKKRNWMKAKASPAKFSGLAGKPVQRRSRKALTGHGAKKSK